METFLEWFKGKKTLIANALIGVLALAGALGVDGVPGAESVNEAVDAFGSAAVAVVAFANIVLRIFTTTPVLKSE